MEVTTSEVKPVGTEGFEPQVGAGVVTEVGVEATLALTLPAVSTACTVYEYVVEALTEVSVKPVVVMRLPFTGVAEPLRKML